MFHINRNKSKIPTTGALLDTTTSTRVTPAGYYNLIGLCVAYLINEAHPKSKTRYAYGTVDDLRLNIGNVNYKIATVFDEEAFKRVLSSILTLDVAEYCPQLKAAKEMPGPVTISYSFPIPSVAPEHKVAIPVGPCSECRSHNNMVGSITGRWEQGHFQYPIDIRAMCMCCGFNGFSLSVVTPDFIDGTTDPASLRQNWSSEQAICIIPRSIFYDGTEFVSRRWAHPANGLTAGVTRKEVFKLMRKCVSGSSRSLDKGNPLSALFGGGVSFL